MNKNYDIKTDAYKVYTSRIVNLDRFNNTLRSRACGNVGPFSLSENSMTYTDLSIAHVLNMSEVKRFKPLGSQRRLLFFKFGHVCCLRSHVASYTSLP